MDSIDLEQLRRSRMKKEPTNKDNKSKALMKSLPRLPDDHPLFTRGFFIGGRGFNRPRIVKEKQGEQQK